MKTDIQKQTGFYWEYMQQGLRAARHGDRREASVAMINLSTIASKHTLPRPLRERAIKGAWIIAGIFPSALFDGLEKILRSTGRDMNAPTPPKGAA